MVLVFSVSDAGDFCVLFLHLTGRPKSHQSHYLGFEVLTAASMKMAVFWVVVPCSLVEVYRSP
jgi:hypothetical protein